LTDIIKHKQNLKSLQIEGVASPFHYM